MGLETHRGLFHIAYFEFGISVGHIFLNFVPEVTDDKDELRIGRIGEVGERTQYLINHQFVSHADELLGATPGMRPQAGTKTRHKDNDFQG